MNREEFQIWKTEKERKYDDDLEILRNDLANRGLTFSGVRKKAEERLRQILDSDIKIVRMQMEEAEKRKSEWFPDGNWHPLLLSTFISILIGIVVFYLTQLK